MRIYRYPAQSLLSDSLRAVFGITVTVGPLFLVDMVWPLTLIFGLLGLIFLIFALRLVQQSLSAIELSSEGISRHGPVAKRLAWPDVTSLKLAHYGAPREVSDGWYQLIIRGNGGVLKVDSTIDGFDDIVASAVRATAKSGLDFDPVTSDNLKSLGHGVSRHAVTG